MLLVVSYAALGAVALGVGSKFTNEPCAQNTLVGAALGVVAAFVLPL